MRLIDGDALSDWMKDYSQKCIKGERKISLMYVWKHIQDMQTIEERETGEWLPQDHNTRTGYVTTTVYYYPKCSKCGHVGDYSMSFCPGCGARMSGGEQE